MDYGSILYVNDPESTLTVLYRIQNQSLRFALGATKSTPIPAPEYESKVPHQLFLRRIRLAEQLIFRILSNSTSSDLLQFHLIY